MNAKKKIVSIALAASLAATAIVGGTLAYFTDTDEKDNVFTVGKVDITLTEKDWDAGKAKLVPGREIDKTPVITVEDGSEEAYLFAEVTFNADFVSVLEADAEANGVADENIRDYVMENWIKGFTEEDVDVIARAGGDEAGSWKTVIAFTDPKAANESVTLFTDITVPTTVTSDMLYDDDMAKDCQINVTAKAIQAEGMADYHEAYRALYNK